MANIPPYISNQDEQSGELYHSQLNQSLQDNFSDNGILIPNQDATTITALSTSGITGTSSGAMWYDATNNRWIGNENGVLVSFNTTPI